MKRNIFLILASAAIAAGCMREELPPVSDGGFSAETEVFGTTTKTSLDADNCVIWSEDDDVAIFQGYADPSLFRVESSSAGKTSASFKEMVAVTTGGAIRHNVAFYPYDSDLDCSYQTDDSGFMYYEIENVILPEKQYYQRNSFSNGAFVMVAVTSGVDDKRLKFRNVCGALKLRIKGNATIKSISVKGNSGEILAGDAVVKAYVGENAPELTMSSKGSKTVVLDCGNGVKLSKANATTFILSLPPVTFSKGFTVTVTDFDGNKEEYYTDKANTVNRSKILNMPVKYYGMSGEELTYESTVDISTAGTANCYIVSEAGHYRFPAVRGNSSTALNGVESVEVLWETFGTAAYPEVGDLVSEVKFMNGDILFATAAEFNEGNAVIAAKDAFGVILWSWHIWLTDRPAEHVYKNGAGTMMDRNLGATSSEPGDVKTLGLLYQWGRKDPFLGSADIHDDIPVMSTMEWPGSIATTSKTGTVNYSIANPTVELNGYNSSGNDWLYEHDSTLWGVEKTIYDPCPAGWSVPYGGLNSIWQKAGFDESAIYNTEKEGINFTTSNGYTWYPAAYVLDSETKWGAYWTYTVQEDESFHWLFSNDDDGLYVSSYETYRYFKRSVRCYKEGSSSYEPEPSENIVDLNYDGKTANCYIVSEPGKYCFKPVKGNKSSTSVGNVKAAVVLWESAGTTTAPAKGSLVSSVEYKDNKIIFSVPDNFKEGNAVIAATTDNGEILWSWHIWLTDRPAEHVYKNGAGMMMDRNLGATSTVPGEDESLGLLYQWGRKDPFLGVCMDNQKVKSTGEKWPDPVETSKTVGTMDHVASNPMLFICGTETSGGDWYYESRENSLWGINKTVYDPCPVGWKTPNFATWLNAGFETYYFDSYNKGVDFNISGSATTWYPSAGALFGYTGKIDSPDWGFYWSCRLEGSDPLCMIIGEDLDGLIYYLLDRSNAFSIRCEKEE